MRLKLGIIRIDLYDLILFIIALLGFMTLFFTINYNETIVRVLSYAFYLVGYTLYFLSLFISEKIKSTDYVSIFFLIYIIILWTFNGFDYNVLVTSLSFFLVFTSFECARVIKTRERLLSIIYAFYMTQAFMLIFTSFSKYAYMSIIYGVKVSNDLLLGLSNPNETGMVLAYTIIGLFICMKRLRAIYTKFATLLVIGYLIYLVVLTRARTSFIGIIIFVILSIIYKNKKGILFTNKFMYLGFIIIPLAFVPFYLSIYRRFENIRTLFGKSLFSGRENVYISDLLLWNNKMFGNLSTFYLSNAHNGFFTILINFGIFGTILYLIHLIINLVKLKDDKCSCEISRQGFIAILCLYLMSASEAAFIVSGKFYFANFLIITWLANYL